MSAAKKTFKILAGVGALIIGLLGIGLVGVVMAVIISMAFAGLICCAVMYVAVIAFYVAIGTVDIDEVVEILRDGPPKRDFVRDRGRTR